MIMRLCTHPISHENRIGTDLVCTLCGDVLVTKMPRPRTAFEIIADKKQTEWEQRRGL